MSVHQALAELKTYKSRISNGMDFKFVVANKRMNEKIGTKNVTDYAEAAKSAFASVTALIANEKAIKCAIDMSNAQTKVRIGDKDYTIVEAIARKSMIVFEENLLSTLKMQYNAARRKVESENDMLQDKLEKYLQNVLGVKETRKPEDIDTQTKYFEGRETYDLIDPCGIEDYIKKLETDILTFKGEVDYRLSESNATTMIDVVLED
jgi:hypothetical protein